MRSMIDVYITKAGKFLPNNPISNDEMESYLGLINDKASKARGVVLRNNGIKTRYYALDKNGNPTHTNADLTYKAIEQLYDKAFTKKDIEMLSCGTSTPDNFLPSHAAMVHGLMKNRSVELNSSSGVCCAGMNALKVGYLSVKSGNTKNAVCTGSERVSTWMLANKFNNEVVNLEKLQQQPILSFKKDFLRWMLSDGAGALLLENKPKGSLSLKIEWMEAYSYAHELEACMYAGGEKLEDGSIKPWSDYHPEKWLSESIFAIKQDVKILDEHIMKKGSDSLKLSLNKHHINASEIDFFLAHMSSYYFVAKLQQALEANDIHIPENKWYLNLDSIGNVGSASIYITLEELMASGKLKKGNKIMLVVPESGRFSFAHAYLTVC